MKRAALERDRTERQWRAHLALHTHQYTGGRIVVSCICDTQAGRFRKRDAHDCGRPQCHTCHSDKIFEVPTPQLMRSDVALREGMSEGCSK